MVGRVYAAAAAGGRAQRKQKHESESFLPVKAREELEKALVAIKLELYKEGVQEYHLQVKRAGNSITLTVLPGKG